MHKENKWKSITKRLVRRLTTLIAILIFFIGLFFLWVAIFIYAKDNSDHSFMVKFMATLILAGPPLFLGAWLYRRFPIQSKWRPSLSGLKKSLQMKKGHKEFWKLNFKGFLLFIFLYSIITYRLFAPNLFDPFFYDICSDAYVNQKVEEHFKRGHSGTQKQRDKFNDLTKLILEHSDMKPENLAMAMKLGFKFYVLRKNQCPIPEILERDFYVAIGADDGSGTKNCPINMFFEENSEMIKDMMKYPASYKKFEDYISIKILENIKIEENAKIFNEKWKDPDFRKKILIAFLQVEDRIENSCKLQGKPFLNELLDAAGW